MKADQKKLVRVISSLVAILLIQAQIVFAQTRSITVQVDKPGAAVPKTLFGLFFEDINFGADGGLYPERVKNRSFEFPNPMMGWKQLERGDKQGQLQVLITVRSTTLQTPTTCASNRPAAAKVLALRTKVFAGLGLQKGAEYRFSIRARRIDGSPAALRVEVEDGQRVLGETSVSGFTNVWKTYTSTLKSTDTSGKAHLNLLLEGNGTVDIDLVSLYPKDTWQNRPNGLRADLVKFLKDMKPGFLRFPGGCIVEGRTLEQRYQWKTTIGDLEERQLIINRWNTEFNWRPTPDYYQSFGLGYYEYFLLSEDIGAEPLPILNCGMACQFNSSELAPSKISITTFRTPSI